MKHKVYKVKDIIGMVTAVFDFESDAKMFAEAAHGSYEAYLIDYDLFKVMFEVDYN